MRARHPWPVLLFGLAFPTFITWAYFIALVQEPAAAQQAAYLIGKTVQFGFPLLWVWLTRPQRIGRPRQSRPGIVEGVAFGLAISGAMLLTYLVWLKPAGHFSSAAALVAEKVAGIGVLTPVAFLAMALFYSLVHSLMEEYYWRWFVFRELQQVVRLPIAVLVSSLGFMAHHVLVVGSYFGWQSPLTWLCSAGVAIGGAVYWAWLYERSGSLLGPWVSHAIIDAAIFAIGYDLIG